MTAISEFKPLKKDGSRSRTLPGYVYHSAEVYEQEKTLIFDRVWQVVAHEGELANSGDYVTAEIAEEKIFVIRDDDGVLRAFYNVCQHRAHTLLAGTGNVKNAIICPYHAWAYTKSGALKASRYTKTLPDFDPSAFSLREIRLQVACGFVFVNQDPEASTIEETWPGFVDSVNEHVPWWPELSFHSRSDSDGQDDHASNWKVLAENCRECYHCAPAHPAFVDLVDMKMYKREYHDGWFLNQAPVNKLDNAAYTVSPTDPVQKALFWHLWPNNEIGISPGEKNLSAFRYYPSGPETMRVSSVNAAVDGVGIGAECSNYMWNVLWPEDERICDAVQLGLKSKGYRQGRFVMDNESGGESEQGVHEFQLQYAKVMRLPVEE
ncbi:MAG: aromatic ring-hydroxylating dioxygenase subunit alpha [Gammaproteobacteria bacterium]|nr:aromatic ring-hydroxylating dioxygenase subunit alpha [Gammaproteobacteria bacterium]